MIHHLSPVTGRYIVSDHPWTGIGWLVGTAISWLAQGVPTYVYMTNRYYNNSTPDQTSNQWNWFFDQELLDIPYEIKMGRNGPDLTGNNHIPKPTATHFRKLVKEHFRVKPRLLDYAASFVPAPSATLGLHYRGTDKRIEVPRPDYDMVAGHVRRILERDGLTGVLIATDDQEALHSLRARLDCPVSWFRPHIRGTSTEEGIHKTHGSYRQAYETMAEILAVGMCRRLLLGRSCVADSMIMMSQSDADYEYYN